jgi:hypothetical protein
MKLLALNCGKSEHKRDDSEESPVLRIGAQKPVELMRRGSDSTGVPEEAAANQCVDLFND